MNREELIARKEEVHAELARTRGQLAAAQARGSPARSLAELERRIQDLMEEEHRLRLLIDRTR